MTAEEFLEKHFDVLYEALGIYRDRMEYNAGEIGGLARSFPENKTYRGMENDFYKQRDNAKRASDDLFDLRELRESKTA